MFGLFESPRFTDPQLGALERSRGLWRGSIQLPGHPSVPLAVCGDNAAPDSLALAAVKRLASEYATLRSALELGFDAAWDVEHTFGGRYREGRLIELNGSVLLP